MYSGNAAPVPAAARPPAAPAPLGCSTRKRPVAATRPRSTRRHRGLADRLRGVANAASISPSSMRLPRIFTWWSKRPRYSSVPSGSQRHRSPVLYSPLAPAASNGFGHEPLRRQVRAIQVAPGQADAGQVQLARHAHRHRLQAAVQDVALHVGDRPPDGNHPPRIARPAGPGVTSTEASVGPYRLCNSTLGSRANRRSCNG